MGINFDDIEHHHSDCSLDSGCSDFRSGTYRMNGNGHDNETTRLTKTNLTNHPFVHRKPAGNNHGTEFLSCVAELIIEETKIVGDPAWVQANNAKVLDFKQPAELEVKTIISNYPYYLLI